MKEIIAYMLVAIITLSLGASLFGTTEAKASVASATAILD
ncbi:hypothetical protein ABID20_003122 [Rhizobium alvei]